MQTITTAIGFDGGVRSWNNKKQVSTKERATQMDFLRLVFAGPGGAAAGGTVLRGD